MNPLLLLEQHPTLAPLIGMLAGVALAVSPLAWPMAVTTLATGFASTEDGRMPWRPVVAVGAGITAVWASPGSTDSREVWTLVLTERRNRWGRSTPRT